MTSKTKQQRVPRVFVSYSHKDEELKDRLLAHLSVGALKGALQVWTDKKIAPGQNWRDEIRTALRESSLAVLLVTADFLASDATRAEVSELLRRREQEGLPILPVIGKPCLWHEAEWLRSLQVLPRDGKPISSLSSEGREDALAEIAQQVASLWEATAAELERPKGEGREKKGLPDKMPEIFISHSHDDGDFAEVLKSRLEQHGYSAWIDIDRLQAGEDWRQGIDDAIRRSKALVAVMSPKARESEYVTYEWAFAWGCGTRVIPIMLKPISLHPRLESVQYLDFTNRSARPWSKLFEALDGIQSR